MCGRIVQKSSRDEILQEFKVSDAPDDSQLYFPNFNISPMQSLLVIKQEEDGRLIQQMQWSLVPNWQSQSKMQYSTFNARSETISEKATFRQAFQRSRCIVVTNGFYEWKISEDKQPYFIFVKDKPVFGFAGISDCWISEDKKLRIDSCAVITTVSNDLLKPIHERMPVILNPGDYDEWLDLENYDVDSLKRLLIPFDANAMFAHKVSRDVGSVKNNYPELLLPVIKKK